MTTFNALIDGVFLTISKTDQLWNTQQFINQLKIMQKKKDTEYIRRDIEGYQMVLDSGEQDNAKNLLKVKVEARLAGNPFENNVKAVEFMKSKNMWK